ncbi:MAG: hypothetical protein EAY81_05095 [Bacteroidetes bacterium]|nr:MAG: hypothetical protein EAY81_05095 [Bacteroidota bacterium]
MTYQNFKPYFWVYAIGLMLFSADALGQQQPYYFSDQIDSLLKTDSNSYKYQTASWNYSFIGNYKQAILVKEQQYPLAKASNPTDEQKALFKSYYPVDAKAAILKEAAATRLLIINEAHYSGLHRAYLSGLLSDLFQMGYTFIGMEALGYEDTLLQQRGYPLISTGFYTQEPCFGNLIREALKTGMQVFPYEQHYNDSFQRVIGREKSQALNIKAVLDKHPQAKFIIYCGYDHAAEDTLKNFMGLPMAGQLKRLTGIDPFTIDQTALAEYVNVGNRYRKLMAETHPVLYADSASRYFNLASFPKAIDCNIYHPNTEYVLGRPSWLVTQNTRLVLLGSKVKMEFPCLLKVYLESDDRRVAVPIDVVEIKSADEQVASVVLKHKKQVVVVENKKGDKQVIEVK